MKILLFFCDIEGTLTDKKNELEYNLLFDKIEEMKKLYECDACVFSLMSMNTFNDVFKWYEKMKSNKNVVFGKQFYENGYFEVINGLIYINDQLNDKTKLGNMKYYIEELSKNNEIKMLFYADDNLYDVYTNYFKRLLSNNAGIKLIKPADENEEYENDVVKRENVGFNGLLDGLDTIIEKKKTKKVVTYFFL